MSSIEFSFGDLIDESAERAGVDPAALTHRHLASITRSLQLVFTEIEKEGATAEYRTETLTVPLPAGYGAVQLPRETIDVSGVALVVNGAPYPLGRTTREDYQTLSYPSSSGTPSIFWLSKTIPPESAFLNSTLGADYLPSLDFRDPRNTQNLILYPAWPVGGAPLAVGEGPFLVLWPQNGLTAGQLTVTRVRQINMPGGFGEQLDARHPRIGPTRGYGHEYTPHPIYTKWHATTATVCIWCDCRKDWLTLIGSKVCSAHTTHMKKEAARGRSDRPQHDSGSRLAGAHDE